MEDRAEKKKKKEKKQFSLRKTKITVEGDCFIIRTNEKGKGKTFCF